MLNYNILFVKSLQLTERFQGNIHQINQHKADSIDDLSGIKSN